MFYKIEVLKSFANSTKETPVLESFFNKVAEPAKPTTLIKGDSKTVVLL